MFLLYPILTPSPLTACRTFLIGAPCFFRKHSCLFLSFVFAWNSKHTTLSRPHSKHKDAENNIFISVSVRKSRHIANRQTFVARWGIFRHVLSFLWGLWLWEIESSHPLESSQLFMNSPANKTSDLLIQNQTFSSLSPPPLPEALLAADSLLCK